MHDTLANRRRARPLPRSLVLAAFSVLGGVLLAAAWETVWPDTPVFGMFLEPLSGGTVLALAPVIGFALVAGALRVLMPCGMPVLFTVLPVLQASESRRHTLISAAGFTLGTVTVLALFGAMVGGLGNTLYWLFDPGPQREVFTRVIYTSTGAFLLAYGLAQLGVIRLPPVPNPLGHLGITRAIGVRSPFWRSLAMGATVGGGLGAACPLATSIAVVAWVGTTGNPLLGAVVETAFGLGIVAPPLLLAVIARSGALPQIGMALWAKRQIVTSVAGTAMVVLGVGSLLFWGLLSGGM